jgi:hypothetical protein
MEGDASSTKPITLAFRQPGEAGWLRGSALADGVEQSLAEV